MGNLAGTESERAENLSEQQLKSKLELDTEYSQLDSQIWDPKFLSTMKEIDAYDVPFDVTSSAPEGKIEETEISAVFLQDRDSSSIENLKTEIQKQITHVAGQTNDQANTDVIRRMKSIYRIHEAMVRQDLREKNKLATQTRKKVKDAKYKADKITHKNDLPRHLKLSFKFVLQSLLMMLKSTRVNDPNLYREILNMVTELLSEQPPCSLEDTQDDSIESGFEQVGNFFE